jgi:hypothetical protein
LSLISTAVLNVPGTKQTGRSVKFKVQNNCLSIHIEMLGLPQRDFHKLWNQWSFLKCTYRT